MVGEEAFLKKNSTCFLKKDSFSLLSCSFKILVSISILGVRRGYKKNDKGIHEEGAHKFS